MKTNSSLNLRVALTGHKIDKLTGHKIDYDGVKILDRADSDPKHKVKEILHTDKRKPTLNTQVNSQTEFRFNVNIVGSKKKK